jgi:hypothetical protein
VDCAIDYSFARPDPAAIARAGYVAVLRYLSTDPSKNLSAPERDALFAAGLGIRLVWETTASRATEGQAAGAADAQAANDEADALGYPADQPIYFAVDEQTTWASVASYFAGAVSAGRRPVKAYGDDTICDGAAAAGLGSDHWQSEAWSGTTVCPNAALYQRISPTHPPIPGGGYDEDAILQPITWWTAPAPPPAHTEDNMQSQAVTVHITSGHGWVPSPVPAAAVVSVVAFDIAPETIGTYDTVPVFVGVATNDANVPNGVLVFGPGGDGPAADGNYGFVVWSVS